MQNLNSICEKISIQGADASSFLNNLLISDLDSWPALEFIYSALCNPKGRIICSLWVQKLDAESFIVLFPKDMTSFVAFLKMRLFRMKVKIGDYKESYAINDDGHVQVIDSETYSQNRAEDQDNYQLLLNQLGLPWISAKNTEKFIPQHVNLDQHENIMSFTKGCYPGQEIIARMKFLGKIKKRMKLYHLESEKELENFSSKDIVSALIANPESGKFEIQIISPMS